MSQFDFGNLSSPLSGAAFIDGNMEPWRDALHSSHSGTVRPTYAVNGTFWLDTTTTPYIYKMFDGTDDITIGTINATTNEFVPANTGHYGGSAGGTANVLTLTPAPALGSYAAGIIYNLLLTATNTASAPTINVSGLGAKTVKYNNGSGKVSLPIGGLQNGTIATIIYDGTDFVLLNARPYNPATAIASAATINLDSALGDYVSLTGTTTVTAITLKQGQECTCVAAAAFILTNGASLILPSGANITTAAGDSFVVRGEAAGVVRIVSYIKADGTGLIGSGTRVLLETQTAAADASIDFTTGIDATYDSYIIEGIAVKAAVDSIGAYIRTSTDGGATFDAGAGNYIYAGIGLLDATVANINGTSDTKIQISHTMGNVGDERFNFTLKIFNPSDVNQCYMEYSTSGFESASRAAILHGTGIRLASADVDAIRILMSSGNITSGTFKLYGIK